MARGSDGCGWRSPQGAPGPPSKARKGRGCESDGWKLGLNLSSCHICDSHEGDSQCQSPNRQNGDTCPPSRLYKNDTRPHWPVVTVVLSTLWAGSLLLLPLSPGSALSPVVRASSTAVTPASDTRPTHQCQPTSAGTCPSQPQYGAAGLGPVWRRGPSAWCLMRKPRFLDRPRLPLLVILYSGSSPGPEPASSP